MQHVHDGHAGTYVRDKGRELVARDASHVQVGKCRPPANSRLRCRRPGRSRDSGAQGSPAGRAPPRPILRSRKTRSDCDLRSILSGVRSASRRAHRCRGLPKKSSAIRPSRATKGMLGGFALSSMRGCGASMECRGMPVAGRSTASGRESGVVCVQTATPAMATRTANRMSARRFKRGTSCNDWGLIYRAGHYVANIPDRDCDVVPASARPWRRPATAPMPES